MVKQHKKLAKAIARFDAAEAVACEGLRKARAEHGKLARRVEQLPALIELGRATAADLEAALARRDVMAVQISAVEEAIEDLRAVVAEQKGTTTGVE